MNKKSKLAAAPYLLWMIVFIVVPLLLIAVFAFTTTATCDANGNILSEEELAEYLAECEENEVEPDLTEKNVFTFQNILDVSKYSTVLVNSAWLALIATAICLVIAYPLAYMISRMFYSRQKLALMLVMLPMWMNFLLRTYAWMSILENKGFINQFLNQIGLISFLQNHFGYTLDYIPLINTSGAVVLGMVYNFLPFMVLPIYTVLIKLDPKIIEAAQDLGAPMRIVFQRVIFPLSLPGVISGITMVFVPSVSTFVISKLLGGGKYMLIGDLIDLEFMGNAYNPQLGSAIALVMMGLIFLCMWVMNKFDDGSSEEGGLML